jgi:enamine deaminase RidA (YjgF/YER057c/UK114 family)
VRPVAPYSHAVELAGWLFVAGHLAADPEDDSRPMPNGIAAQTRKVMDNPRRVLKGPDLESEYAVMPRLFAAGRTNARRRPAAASVVWTRSRRGQTDARTRSW